MVLIHHSTQFWINVTQNYNLAAPYNTVEEPGVLEEDVIGNLPPGPEAKAQEGVKCSGLKVILPEMPPSLHQGRRKFASV